MPKKSWSKGAKKAYASMTKRYGKKKGEAVFYAKANKVTGGKGRKSQTRQVSSVYKKGGSQKARRKK